MAFELSEINHRAKTDPKEFIDECDAAYARKISHAVDMIIDNMPNSRIVLLSGPSGSGKTTTSKKIEEELIRRGVHSHAVAMDDYFRSRNSFVIPKTPSGEPDFESPVCLDMELLTEHFDLLEAGKNIVVPKFDFPRQTRVIEPARTLRLHKDEIAVFEGIHALNDEITGRHPSAFKLYVSSRSDVEDNDEVIFKRTWMRLVRRTVRDNLFRGASALSTLEMWANVRRGEKKFISPFKHQANLMLDSSFAYEVSVLSATARELFDAIPSGIERFEELRQICTACKMFVDISIDLLNPDSLLREFVGGGIYD